MAKNNELFLTAKGKLKNVTAGPANTNDVEVLVDFLDLNVDGIRLMKAEIISATVGAGGNVPTNIKNVTLYLYDGTDYHIIKSLTGAEIDGGTIDFLSGGNTPEDGNGNTYFNFDYPAGGAKLAIGITPNGTSFQATTIVQVYHEEYS